MSDMAFTYCPYQHGSQCLTSGAEKQQKPSQTNDPRFELMLVG
jgi:hypothetical protein